MLEMIDIFTIVKWLLYSILLYGTFVTLKDFFKLQHSKFKMIHRLKNRKKLLDEKSIVERHLTNLLAVSLKRNVSLKFFLWFSCGIFLIVFIIGLQSMTILGAGACAIFIGFIPYLSLKVKLESSRRKGSFEGEQLVSELLGHYTICKYNIFEALEKVATNGKGMKVSKILIYKLLLEIRSTGNPEDIKRATEKFSYGIDTNWSRMMANNIKIASEKGINISRPLEDILIQLREARSHVEERKRLNAESVRMVIFLIPALYIGTVLMTVHYLELPVASFIRNQFYTGQGFTLFLLSFILFGINIILLEFVSHQRFDY